MGAEDNPLDRISSGPAPTPGPQAWRSSSAPVDADPWTSTAADAGARPKSGGLIRKLAFAFGVVALAFVALVAWSMVSKPVAEFARAAPTPLAPPPPPPAPTVDQITANAIFSTALATPGPCALPVWSTDRAAMQAFAATATACLEKFWNLPTQRVDVFSAPGDIPPGAECDSGEVVKGIQTCRDITFVNAGGITASAGNQAGRALQWLALAVAHRAERRAGVSADVDALVDTTGGAPSPQGTEYVRREHAQNMCLTGTTVGRLVNSGINPADRDQASEAARDWTILGKLPDHTVSRNNNQAWFDKGSLAPDPSICRSAWTVPVDLVN